MPSIFRNVQRLGRRGSRPVCLAMVAALLSMDGAAASAFVRFANASLQEAPAADRLQLRLDDAVVVDELGYKSATGYIEVAAGEPQFSVWYQGVRLLERQLDLREDESYSFVLLGNGESAAPYDVTAFYEGAAILEAGAPRFQILTAASYSGHPRAEIPASGPSLRYQQSCRSDTGGVSGSSGSLRFPVGLPIQPPEPPGLNAEPDTKLAGELDPDTCRIEFTGLSVAPGQIDLTFARVGGSWIQLFLIGDGVRAPIEIWSFSQPGRVVDPPPVLAGDWTAGIWIAPDYPGLVFNLELESYPGVSAPTRRLAGIVTGYDRDGQARWVRLNGLSSLLQTEQQVSFSEYLGSSQGGVNDLGLITPTIAHVKFFGCDRARLKISTIYVDLSRSWVIAALRHAPASGIVLQRVTPLRETCPY
jgi:hypothetical protein